MEIDVLQIGYESIYEYGMERYGNPWNEYIYNLSYGELLALVGA